jgi:hypothetical protein
LRNRRTPHFEQDDTTWPADAYRAKRYDGIAWRVLGWETEPDADTEWTGIEERTGNVVAHMVGDDRRFTFEPEDLSPLADLEYCATCGQIGCAHDGRDREEEN